MKIDISESGDIMRADGFSECVESRPDTAQVTDAVMFINQSW